MAERKRSNLIQMLLNEGLITEAQLVRAKAGIHTNCEVYSLISSGYISDIRVASYVVKNARIPYVMLDAYDIKKEPLMIVLEEYCSLNCCLPLEKLGNDLTVAMIDPLDEQVIQELTNMTKMVIRPVLCSLRDFLNVMKIVWIDITEEVPDNGKEKDKADIVES